MFIIIIRVKSIKRVFEGRYNSTKFMDSSMTLIHEHSHHHNPYLIKSPKYYYYYSNVNDNNNLVTTPQQCNWCWCRSLGWATQCLAAELSWAFTRRRLLQCRREYKQLNVGGAGSYTLMPKIDKMVFYTKTSAIDLRHRAPNISPDQRHIQAHLVRQRNLWRRVRTLPIVLL